MTEKLYTNYYHIGGHIYSMSHELSFAMLGSTGAGKTTLLACMNKELERLNPGTFFPKDPQSFSTLNKAYNALKDEATDRTHYEFGVGVAGTEALSEYVFTIRGSTGSTEAKFYDFPGGWMAPDNTENFEKVREIISKSMVIIAAVNTPYLMESNGKYRDRAKITEMIHLLKMSLEDTSQDKLFLIVPIKCEKYTRTPRDKEKLQKVLADEFAEVFRLKDNPSYQGRLAIVMLPVHTAGNVYFSRFETDGHEVYTKNREKGFSPQYVDQPLRIAMSFLLGTSPRLAADTGLRDSAEYIRKGMTLDNPDFTVICGRDLILGQKVSDIPVKNTPPDRKELPITNTPPIPPAKPSDKYTLAIMGATGAGKTVFLLSYFYSALQLGRGRHTIAVSDEATMQTLTRDIDSLINRGILPIGTSQYNDMSFTVSNSMNVDLFDVPGGDTQGLAPKISQRLRSADGAIFFIDGEDLVHQPEKVLADNIAFGKAISMLRENTLRNSAGRVLGRKDVPIWFVITKCDAIPEISDDELKKHLAALLRSASDDVKSGKWAEKLFRKGKRVKIFRTQSMGKWSSPTTPPDNAHFSPVNVTEVMDSMIDEMRRSEKSYSRLLRVVLAGMAVTGAAAGLIFAYYTVWQTDHIFWRSAMGRVDTAIVQENYAEARREIDEFISPSYMGLYLKPTRADNLKDTQAYPKLEAAMYSELTRRLGAINYDIMPEITASFMKTKDLLTLYLDVKQFETLAKNHYENVKDKEWYFRAGSDYNYVPAYDAKPDDVRKAVERCLNRDYSTPATWREMERVKLEGMLRTWINMLPTNVDTSEFDVYTSRADQLINNPSMPQVLRDYLKEQQTRWAGLKSDQWRQTAEGWITEALRLPVNDGIRTLNVHLAKTEISEPARERLRGALGELYLKQADEWVNSAFAMSSAEGVRELEVRRKTAGSDEAREHIDEGIKSLHVREAEEWIAEASSEKVPYSAGIAKLREHLAKTLIPEARNVLENGLVNLWNHQADDWIREAMNARQAAQGINTLRAALSHEGIPQAVKSRLERGLENLQTREADELVSQALDLRDKGRGEEAVRLLQARIDRESSDVMKSRLQRELESLRSWLVDSWIAQAESQELDTGITFLASHMKDAGISENDRIKIDDKIYDMERRLIVNWLNEAHNVKPEDRISVLALYYEKAPTDNVKDRIQREIGSTYNEIVNQALNEYPDDVQKLRELFTRLSRGREMPAQVRETLQTAITAAENKARDVELRTILQRIGSAPSFNALGRELRDIDVNNEAVQTQTASTVQKLLGNESSRLQNAVNDYLRSNRFSEGRKYVENECRKLREEISYSISGKSRNAVLAQLETMQSGMLDRISSSHLRLCRSNFESRRRTTSGITETISELNVYLAVWPDSREVDTVSRVISYLRAIEKGFTGYFTVTHGYFTNTGRTFDTPDIRLEVSGAVRLNTPLIENSEQPYFGEGCSLTWRPNMGAITIRAYEVDTFGSDIECLNVTITASGWDGWRNLTRTYMNNGNSISVSFSASVPSCPW